MKKMKKINKTPLAAAMGTVVISAFATGTAHAEANPFAMSELSEGYMQVAEASRGYSIVPAPKSVKEAACGEGKCGGMMDGEKMKKGMEGACGDMMKGKDGACGDMMKGKEAACGEGKCGGMMDGEKMKKGMEGACGDMMKGKEGACGDMAKEEEGSCGAMMKEKEGACGMNKAVEGKCGEGKCGEGKCAANK